MVAVSVSSKHRTPGGRLLVLISLDHELQERLVLQRLAGQVDGEARDLLAHRRAVFAEQLAGAMHHPAIHRGHELVALRRREKFARRDDFAAVAQHADQHLEARTAVIAPQRQNGLRIETETVVAERVAQLADDQDVGVPPDDALIRILEHFDAVAAAVLGRLAGDLRRRQGMRERIVRAADRRDAETDGHLERALSRRAARWRRLPRESSPRRSPLRPCWNWG